MNKDFTDKQKELIDLFLTTKTQAKVLRRKALKDGTYEFYEHIRDTSPIDFPVNEEEFAIKVHEKTPDAPLSPIYVNMRNLPQDLIEKIGHVMSEITLKDRPDFCTGIPNTAVAFAKEYSNNTHIPYLDVYEKSGTSTNRRLINFPSTPRGEGQSLLIIDDVISQGNSKFEAIKVAQDLGYTIAGILVLIDRSQGGSKQLEKQGINVYSVFTLPSLVKYYFETHNISEEKYNQITSYLSQM